MPDQHPRVSVVLPVFNGERHLSEAAESILAQTFSDLELILVDDGSTDATPRILRELAADDRVVVIRHPRNKGLVAALNTGVEAVSGELIARQDADDVSLPTRIERQVAFLDENPDVGVLATAYYKLRDGERVAEVHPPATDTEIRWRLLFGNPWAHPSVILRRECLADGDGVYRDFAHAEDLELWMRLAGRTELATLDEPLIECRSVPSGVSRTFEAEQETTARELSERQIRDLLPHHSPPFDDLRAALRPSLMDAVDPATVQRMLDLFAAFEAEPGTDLAILRRVRRRWIRQLSKRLTSASPDEQAAATGVLRRHHRWAPLFARLANFIASARRRLTAARRPADDS